MPLLILELLVPKCIRSILGKKECYVIIVVSSVWNPIVSRSVACFNMESPMLSRFTDHTNNDFCSHTKKVLLLIKLTPLINALVWDSSLYE